MSAEKVPTRIPSDMLPSIVAGFVSRSDSAITWYVMDLDGVLRCECPGYTYRQSCIHTRTIADERAHAAMEESRQNRAGKSTEPWRQFADPPKQGRGIGPSGYKS